MAPTRELTQNQIISVINSLGTLMNGLKTQLIIGGQPIEKDIKGLKDNPHIICGCPGRIHDMIKRKHIKIHEINIMIIDEADEMLSAGFKDQSIFNIFILTYNVQICLFSATIPNDLCISLTDKFLKSRKNIDKEMLTLEGIAQYFIALEKMICKNLIH